MRYSEIDRFIESHDSTLANITAILYQRLGCKKDASYDYILEKLRDIEEFDGSIVPTYSQFWDTQKTGERGDNGTT